MPEVRIYPDRELATLSGVTVDAIASTVQAAIGGAVQGKFTNKDRRYDVRLRLEGGERISPNDILALDVRTDYGELIPISSVIKTETVGTYQTIARTLRERSISIYANIAPGKSQAAALDRAEAIAKNALPPGYRVFLGGGAQTFRETFASLFFALWLGVVVSYMVLASQFNSFIHPLAVLLSLPFCISGAFFALLLTGQSINLYSLIGLVLLMGIVKKKLDPARGVHQREAFHRRLLRARCDSLRWADPFAPDPDDLARHARCGRPARAGSRARSGKPHSDGHHRHRRRDRLDFFTLLVVPCAYSLMAKLESKSHPEAELYSEAAKPVMRPGHEAFVVGAAVGMLAEQLNAGRSQDKGNGGDQH